VSRYDGPPRGVQGVGAAGGRARKTPPGPAKDKERLSPKGATVHRERILIADGDRSLAAYLESFLARLGYEVFCATTGENAVHIVRSKRPGIVLLDLHIPGQDGLETLRKIRQVSSDTYVVIMSRDGLAKAVVTTMKMGAADFLRKPFDQDELLATIGKEIDRRELAREVNELRDAVRRRSEFQRLFQNSEKMKRVQAIVEQVADTDITVLIFGESGTGKELVARAIYAMSSRRDKPFLKVNCAALPEALLESELFGYEKGAFTGATSRKPGKFEVANGGTILLDEIAEMAPSLQAKLLQVLQDNQFSRLGGGEDIHVDVRVIATTNRDISRSVAEGTFREDLFYRLNVVNITVPPLRERVEEIPLLIEYFLGHYSKEFKKRIPPLSPELLELFQSYDWPGNVRELENVVKKIVILGDDKTVLRELEKKRLVQARHVSPAERLGAFEAHVAEKGYSLKAFSKEAIRRAEREIIGRVLQQTCWNRKEAAERLQISYKALLYKIKETGLDRERGLDKKES